MVEPRQPWTPQEWVLVAFAGLICVELLGATLVPLVTGIPLPQESRQAVEKLIFLIAGVVIGWLTKKD